VLGKVGTEKLQKNQVRYVVSFERSEFHGEHEGYYEHLSKAYSGQLGELHSS
jgi:hypothetical protein